MDTNRTPAETSFGENAFDAIDEAEMTVIVGGAPSTWKWRFAGPGHPKAVEQTNRVSKERLRRDASIERARANGKQFKPEVEDVDAVRARNVAMVVERLLGWSPVRIGGEALAFSPEAATAFLSDPRKAAILVQAIDFLADESSFTRRSATT